MYLGCNILRQRQLAYSFLLSCRSQPRGLDCDVLTIAWKELVLEGTACEGKQPTGTWLFDA